MADLEMKVVKHPKLDVKYTVPAEDVPRWESQGWAATDDKPTPVAPEVQTEEDLTVAQKAGIGLLPVAEQQTVEELV